MEYLTGRMHLGYPQRMSLSGRIWAATLIAAVAPILRAQQPEAFTLQQILSAPYATSLTAAPVGSQFAWVEDSEGRHNLFVGGPNQPVRELTHNTEDDAQDIAQLAWSPDAGAIAYTYGAEYGASGKPANPAHLQRATAVEIVVQPLVAGAKPVVIGEGHSPLFLRDGHTLLFLRDGKIWCEDLGSTAAQLVYERGSASQLTLSPDGNTLAYISRRREEGEPSHSFLALFDLRTHTLTFPAPSTGNDSAPAFSPEGKSLAWLRDPFTEVPEFANPRSSANPWSIQLLDLTSHATRTVFTPEPNKPGSVLPHMATGEPTLLWAINPNTGFVVNNDRTQPNQQSAATFARTSFESQTHSEPGSTADAPSDDSIPWLFFFSEADGYVHLYGIDPQHRDSKPVPYSEGKIGKDTHYEVEDATIAPDGRTLYYSSNQMQDDPLDLDRRHVWTELIEPYFGGVGPVQITNGEGIETHPALSADGKWIAELVSSPTAPMHVQFLERQAVLVPSGDLQPKIAHIVPAHLRPESEQYPADKLVTPHQALFDSTDGQHLHSQLFLPPNLDPHAKHPAILFVHGGPNRQMLLGYPPMDYYSNAYAMNQYLTSRGFIVLSLNYRCGIGYGMEFRDCVHAGADGAMEYNDVLAAAKYLRSRADVDAAHIGIWGGSYGGYLTALALARNSDLFAAGVDFHGVHDWNMEDNATDWRIGTYAQRDAIAAKALASSPLADLSRWTSPILLIHGDDDPDVAYAQTPLLADALRARNAGLPANAKVEVEELIFPDEVHGFLLHKDWLAAYTAAADFLERTLKAGNRK
jgi:dipeptidyl aminopeptidase/acylaminoacyl peptidase